ncbi:hypothetical protein BDAP_001912 [Binucleata daphniae]
MQEILKKIPIKTQKDFVYANFEYTKEKEIFSNQIQQQPNDIDSITKKIEKCKNIKKNTVNYIKLTEETKKMIYKDAAFEINHFKYKINNMKNYLLEYNLYICNSFMEDDVIEAFNLAKYMPGCITKYAHNKDVFDKQTETIKTLFVTGFIDFDEFYNTLDEEIDYDDDDKEILAKLVDTQMNDFLHKNIKSLTLLFPKMQFFMDYYNKYQDDLVFFVDTRHVCMVYGMMHILETILKCTEHIVSEIKVINNVIIKCGKYKMIFVHDIEIPKIAYFLVTLYEIEKMLLYILQSFLPTDHFIDLVNLFHIESVCSLGIFKFNRNQIQFKKPNEIESSLLQMSTYCYIHFDVLETDESGAQKNVSHIFFSYFVNDDFMSNIFGSPYLSLNPQSFFIYNKCFSIYIHAQVDKLCSKLKKTYDRLVEIHNYMQNTIPVGSTINKYQNLLQQIVPGSTNKIFDRDQNDKQFVCHSKTILFHGKERQSKYTNFHAVVFSILNCICNSIIASEATILMSYDIIRSKNAIKNVIKHHMQIIENWHDKKFKVEKIDETVLFFQMPKILKIHAKKQKQK